MYGFSPAAVVKKFLTTDSLILLVYQLFLSQSDYSIYRFYATQKAEPIVSSAFVALCVDQIVQHSFSYTVQSLILFLTHKIGVDVNRILHKNGVVFRGIMHIFMVL